MLDQLDRVNVLYDIYAPLLTERRREVLRLYYSDNYSLGEIAEHYAVSRQAIHDLLRKALLSIEILEDKLGLYNLFLNRRRLLSEAEKLLKRPSLAGSDMDRLRCIISELRESNEQ